MEKIVASVPVTIANVGPGFYVFGFAVDSPVDIVFAEKLEDSPKTVIIKETNLPELPTDPNKNTAGIAAHYILKNVDADSGVEFYLQNKNVKITEITDIPDLVSYFDMYDSEGNRIQIVAEPGTKR